MNTHKYNPDPLAPWSEKTSDNYGLAWAKLIAKEWFDGGMITDKCQYGTRRDYVINKRLLARGQQDLKKYKDHFQRQDGDLDYLNLNFQPVNIAGKFTKVVSNGISDDYYGLDIQANDRLSLMNKKERIDEYRNNMRSMPLLQKVKQQLGINLIPQGFIPEDEEELQLYAEIKDRPKIEIAEEITIKYVNDTNNQKSLERKKNKDLVEVGIAAERIWTDPMNGVQFKYVDAEYLVHSYVNCNDFTDAYYYGYVDTITLNDLQRESGFDQITLRKVALAYQRFNDRHDYVTSCNFNDLLDYKVHVLRYAFKTNKTDVYKVKKKEGRAVKATKRDESYIPPERHDYGRLDSTKDTWMEGTYILDSNYVYSHKECENLIRDERNKAMSPFNVKATDIYKNQLHSFLDDIEPFEFSIQQTHLKIQHLRAELKPDLVEIDLDSLADLTTKGDKQKTWETALNIMNVKGVVFTKRMDMGEMGIKDRPSARPMPVNQGSALGALLNIWAHDYNAIRDATGVNPARDGSLPHDALLGVNQMAQLASNTATQHIVEASIEFNKVHCETISARIHNIFKSKSEGAEKLREMYRRAVGKQNIDALESMANRHLHDFGFTVNMVPTQKEIQEFKEDLSISLQEGLIDVEVKNEAQQIAKTNMKLASQYLFYMRKKRRKQLIEEKQREAQFKSQNDIKAAQAATQAKTQSYAIEANIDLEKESKMVRLRVMEEQAMLEIRLPKEERDFKKEVFLKQLEETASINKSKYMEDRKDQRVDKQSTQQSKMINQRTFDTSPIDFEEQDWFYNIFNS